MFEIHVAVIGYVSVGKTTVINALFGEEYGEVAMKRTTSVVNYFRISASQGATASGSASQDEDPEDDSVEVDPKKLSASATLKETTADNAAFRNSQVVKKRSFDISLDEDLHKMRPDTKLVIVDVPGMNEAGTSSKYKDFVNDNWHTFDIVVVVMDARQGVNTEEQHDLLKLVKDNKASKHVPVIILGNKVDDPHNQEQEALLEEARAAVGKLFGVNDRKTALETLFDPSRRSRSNGLLKFTLFPAVIPISAMHAFVYRCGSRLSFDEFCDMDADFIDKIGKDSYGRQWHRFGKEKKLKKAFEAVSEKEQRMDGVEASNFDSFVKVLGICIGDYDRQSHLIQKQIEVAVKRIEEARPNCDLGAELLSARNKLVSLKKSADHLPAAFWKAYKSLKTQAFKDFKKDFSPKAFACPVVQLHNYAKALQTLQWPGEMEEVVKAAKEVVLQYAVFVTDSDAMKAKSENDQFLILGSMLLASSETFNAHFGFLRLHLESKSNHLNCGTIHLGECSSCKTKTTPYNYNGVTIDRCNQCDVYYYSEPPTNCPWCIANGYGNQKLSFNKENNGIRTARCNNCAKTFRRHRMPYHKMKVANGKLVPEDEKAYKAEVTVVVPDSLDDPDHFGHVLWKCCQLLKVTKA